MRNARTLWRLTQVVYAIGLILPIGAWANSPSVAVASATACPCACVLGGGLVSEGGPAASVGFIAAALLLSLAHLSLGWAWLAYARRSGADSAVASGLAASYWLAVLAITLAIRDPESRTTLPVGWGYWCCLVGMTGQCLLAVLTRRRLSVERRVIRSAAKARTVATEDGFRKWVEGQ